MPVFSVITPLLIDEPDAPLRTSILLQQGRDGVADVDLVRVGMGGAEATKVSV